MKPLILVWLAVTAALLLGPLRPHAPGFNARFVVMPASINLETYRAARKASVRPSYCMWSNYGKCWTA